MKTRTTLLLFSLVLVLGGFIVLHERHQPDTREREVLGQHPFSFDAATADEIEITRKDETFRLLRRNGGWDIAQPFDDRADADMVKQFLEMVTKMESVESLRRGDLDKEDQRRTSLGESTTHITIRNGGKAVAAFRFGAEAQIEGCHYVSPAADKETLFVIRTKLAEFTTRNQDEWRDARLLRLKPESVLRFAFSAGAGVMEFHRTAPGQPWSMVKPLATLAAEDRVDAVLTAFLNLKVKPLATTLPAPQSGDTALPVMHVTLEGPSLAKPVSVTFQPGTDAAADVPVTASDRPGHFLASAKVGDFWKLLPNHLRDQNLVRLPVNQITALRLRSTTHAEVVLDRTGGDKGGQWMLKRFGRTEPANAERVQKLFDALSAAQVRDFLNDAPAADLQPYGLHHPFLTLEWQIRGAPTTLIFGQATDGSLTARRSDAPTIFRISAQLLNAMPPDSLRWRGTKLLNTSIFTVRRLIITEGDKPALALHHRPDDSTWTAHVAGRDVTAQLDTGAANRLLQTVSGFAASDWSSDRTDALAALRRPTLSLQVLIADPVDRNAEPKTVTLAFAPLQPGMDTALYHGRKDEEPDTFLITRELYHQLTAPLLK